MGRKLQPPRKEKKENKANLGLLEQRTVRGVFRRRMVKWEMNLILNAQATQVSQDSLV